MRVALVLLLVILPCAVAAENESAGLEASATQPASAPPPPPPAPADAGVIEGIDDVASAARVAQEGADLLPALSSPTLVEGPGSGEGLVAPAAAEGPVASATLHATSVLEQATATLGGILDAMPLVRELLPLGGSGDESGGSNRTADDLVMERDAPSPFLVATSLPPAVDPTTPADGPWPADDAVTARLFATAALAPAPAAPEDPASGAPALPLPLLPPPPPPVDGSIAATVALGVTFLVGALSALYSRFQKHTLLLAPSRARLHARIVEGPGATLADLAEATGLARGALVHHCQMLEKHGLVVSRHDGLRRRFYPPGKNETSERPPTPKERRILVFLEDEGPLTQSELAARLGVSRQAVHQQVGRLQAMRRIVPEDVAGERRWRPAQDAPEEAALPPSA